MKDIAKIWRLKPIESALMIWLDNAYSLLKTYEYFYNNGENTCAIQLTAV